MGIHTHTTLPRKERKEVIWGQRQICEITEWRKHCPENRRKAYFDSRVERKNPIWL
jgi:hypothetical protein